MIEISVEAYDNLKWQLIENDNLDWLKKLLDGAKVVHVCPIGATQFSYKEHRLGGVDIGFELKDGRICLLSMSSDFSVPDNCEIFFFEIAWLSI